MKKEDKKPNPIVEITRNKPGRKLGAVKSGGRIKGTPNKKTVWLREELENAGLNWGKEFKKAFDSDNLKKAEILASLLPYLNPKIKDKDFEIEEPSKEPDSTKSITESLLNIVK